MRPRPRWVIDTNVLVCADLVVTGDDDLLSLKSFRGFPIVNVAQAVKSFSATT